jgi:hypothetical protein
MLHLKEKYTQVKISCTHLHEWTPLAGPIPFSFVSISLINKLTTNGGVGNEVNSNPIYT